LNKKISNIGSHDIDYNKLASIINESVTKNNSSQIEISNLYKSRAIDISRIVFNMLHVLRTPLSGIIINNDSISKNTSDDEIKNKCEKIAQYIDMIENELNSFNESQNINDDDDMVGFVDRLKNEVKLLLLTANKKIDLSFKNDIDVLLSNYKINCLMLCVSCVVENAMFYTQDNGTINIEFIKTDNLFKIKITNFGSQIEDENKEKIFVEGFSTKGSSGVGLNIAKRIIESNLKGTISFENFEIPNPGVTFIISFAEDNHD